MNPGYLFDDIKEFCCYKIMLKERILRFRSYQNVYSSSEMMSDFEAKWSEGVVRDVDEIRLVMSWSLLMLSQGIYGGV